MKEKLTAIAIALFFACGSLSAFVSERRLRSEGAVLTGIVVRYSSGDMGSSCPIIRVSLEGRRADLQLNTCSTDPPPIGSEATVLYDSKRQVLKKLTDGEPRYFFSMIFMAISLFMLYVCWPTTDKQLVRTAPPSG